MNCLCATTIITAVNRSESEASCSVSFLLKSGSSFFEETEFETFLGKKGNNGLLAFSNDEDVADSCGV
jgi:hypothetical protein